MSGLFCLLFFFFRSAGMAAVGAIAVRLFFVRTASATFHRLSATGAFFVHRFVQYLALIKLIFPSPFLNTLTLPFFISTKVDGKDFILPPLT